VIEEVASQLPRLSEVAHLFGGIFASEYAFVEPAFWHEGVAVFHPSGVRRRGELRNVVVLPEKAAPVVGESQLSRLTTPLASVMKAKGRTRNALLLCSRWILLAHEMAPESNERFVTLFQCLEALCSIEGGKPTAKDEEGFARIDRLLSESDDLEARDAREYLKSAKGRIVNPPLSEKFRRLATKHGGQHADRDVQHFAVLAEARNALVHARQRDVPIEVDGVRLHETVHELAIRYYGRVVETVVAEVAPTVRYD